MLLNKSQVPPIQSIEQQPFENFENLLQNLSTEMLDEKEKEVIKVLTLQYQ